MLNNTTLIYWQLSVSVLLFVAISLCILAFIKIKSSRRQCEQLQTELNKQSQALDLLRQETLSANVHVQQSVVGLKQQQQELLQHLDQAVGSISTLAKQSNEFRQDYEVLKHHVQLLKSESSEQKLYGRAKKMIEMGADIDELVFECDVPRAEAELLLSLYKK